MPLQARQETGFLDRTVRVKGVLYKYQVYVPAEWNKSKQWPVILFLHGAGERGDDGLAQTQVGIGGAIRFHRDRVPAVVVMPQCRKEKWWTHPEMEEIALAALEATVKQFRGDRARLYLTGLSMGGYGTFGLGARQSGKFAALVAICGGVRMPRRPNLPAVEEPAGDPYAAAAGKIGKTPIWIFHGAADATVPVTESQKMVEALKVAGAAPKYTEYPGVGHNSWDKAYGETELWKWLFEQRLSR
jgi:predicted peptidase